MSTSNFTKAFLDDLQPMKNRYWVADTKVSFLRLYVFPTGIKTFYLCRKVKGRPERIKIGRYTDITILQARNQAIKLNSIIALGGNPAQDKKEERKELTVKELYDRYYQEYAVLHTKRPDDNKRMMEFHIFPVIGRYKLREVTSDKIRKMHARIGEQRGNGTANRVLTLVNAVFNFGIRHGYTKLANPCYGLQKFKEYARDRFFNKDELQSFFNALSMESQTFQDYFSLLLFTGARKSNVLAMQWSSIDPVLKRWRIPESETKNGEVNIVALSDYSLGILMRRKATNDKSPSPSLYVFPGTGKQGYLKDPKKAFQRIRDRMQVQDIRMHDLRRTLASYMAISGVSMPIIAKALNHKSQDSTAIYARLNNEPVLEAVNSAVKLMIEIN